MSHIGHEVVACDCGTVIRQCRCMGPKILRVVDGGCNACRAAKEQLRAELGKVCDVAYPEVGRD